MKRLMAAVLAVALLSLALLLPTGCPGDVGARGPAGPAGPAGPQGTQGEVAPTPTHVVVNGTYTSTLTGPPVVEVQDDGDTITTYSIIATYVGTGPFDGATTEVDIYIHKHYSGHVHIAGTGVFTSPGGGTANYQGRAVALNPGEDQGWSGPLIITGIDGDLAGFHAVLTMWGTKGQPPNNYCGFYYFDPEE